MNGYEIVLSGYEIVLSGYEIVLSDIVPSMGIFLLLTSMQLFMKLLVLSVCELSKEREKNGDIYTIGPRYVCVCV